MSDSRRRRKEARLVGLAAQQMRQQHPDSERGFEVTGGSGHHLFVKRPHWPGSIKVPVVDGWASDFGIGAQVTVSYENGNRQLAFVQGPGIKDEDPRISPWVWGEEAAVVQLWEHPCYNNYATNVSIDTGFPQPTFTEQWSCEISRSEQRFEALGLVIYEITTGEHAGQTVCVVAIAEENTPGEAIHLTSLRLRAINFDTGLEVWSTLYTNRRGWGRNPPEGQTLHAQLLPEQPEPKKRALICFGAIVDPLGGDTNMERVVSFDPDTGIMVADFNVFGNSYAAGSGSEDSSYYQNGCHSNYFTHSPYTYPYHRVRRDDNEWIWHFGFSRVLNYPDWNSTIAESLRLQGPTPADRVEDSVWCWRAERLRDYTEHRSSVYCLHRQTGATKWEYRVTASGTTSGVILGCSEEYEAIPGWSNTSMVEDQAGNVYFPCMRWTTSGLSTTWESRIISLDKDGNLRFDTLVDSITESHPGPLPEPAAIVSGFVNHFVLALAETEFGSMLIAVRPQVYTRVLGPTTTEIYPVQTVGINLGGGVAWTLDYWGASAGTEFNHNSGVGRFLAGGQSTSSPWVVLRRYVTPPTAGGPPAPQHAIGIINALTGGVLATKGDAGPWSGHGACVAVGAGSVVVTRHSSEGDDQIVELVKYK